PPRWSELLRPGRDAVFARTGGSRSQRRRRRGRNGSVLAFPGGAATTQRDTEPQHPEQHERKAVDQQIPRAVAGRRRLHLGLDLDNSALAVLALDENADFPHLLLVKFDLGPVLHLIPQVLLLAVVAFFLQSPALRLNADLHVEFFGQCRPRGWFEDDE